MTERSEDMIKKKYKIAIVVLCVLVFFTYGLFNKIKSSSPPSKITAKEIQSIESYLNFEFPESTKVIKAYWHGTDPPHYRFFFEFDKKDFDHFIESFDWDVELEGYKKDYGWQSEQDFQDFKQLAGPIVKQDRVFLGKPGPSEELVWWKPDTKKIKKVFWINDIKLRNEDVYIVSYYVLLIEAEVTYKAYVQASWTSLDGSYMTNWWNLFPWHKRWKFRERESVPYPLRLDAKYVERNIR